MNTTFLFDNVPRKDYISFFSGKVFDPQKVVEALNFKKKDVATGANVSVDSIRYDSKIPQELKDRFEEWANLIQLVGEYFKDREKTLLWFRMSNPLLGDISPRDMIRFGRFKKLLQFVLQALRNNQRAE